MSDFPLTGRYVTFLQESAVFLSSGLAARQKLCALCPAHEKAQTAGEDVCVFARRESEYIFQGELFGLVDQLDLSGQACVGGGIFAALLTFDEFQNFLEADVDQIGV